ncbi:AAA family ATPase [Dyella humi]|uniref:AAA family ATPase n=1 Tax=Dyella humi TaxID=1770547 RepID=A0ABW8IM32_9GAMM
MNDATDAAKHIRQLIKIDPYTATHLVADVQSVGAMQSQLLPEKVLSESLELALTPDSKKPSTVEKIQILSSIMSLHEEATSLLAARPTFTSTLKHLEENPAVERWIETGLELHAQPGSCEFCGNTVTQDRLALLGAHFSKDLVDHKKKV